MTIPLWTTVSIPQPDGDWIKGIIHKQLDEDLYEVDSPRGLWIMDGISLMIFPFPLSLVNKEKLANLRDPTRRRTNENLRQVFNGRL